jgi:hypothetical protein
MDVKTKEEKFTIILNASRKKYIVPIDKNIGDILYFADYNIYLQQIEKVYSVPTGLLNFQRLSKELIWKEFIKDIHRCDLNINGESFKDPNKVLNFLEQRYPTNIVYRTLMFATPDSLALPFEILHNVFVDSKSHWGDLYVVEPNAKKRYYRIDINTSANTACSNKDSSSRHREDITTTDNSINFIFNKNLRLIDIEGNSKFYVYVKIEFDILNENQVFINFSIKRVKSKG